jgi:outer membrane protein OmpA-like peptidoglycan-associated protein
LQQRKNLRYCNGDIRESALPRRNGLCSIRRDTSTCNALAGRVFPVTSFQKKDSIMKTLKTSTLLAVAGAFMVAASAYATTLENVKSTNGNVVRDSSENCVVTKWHGSSACVSGDVATLELRTVYFEFDSAVLTPAAKAKLDTLAATLTSGGPVNVRIVGFADKIGDPNHNVRLSQRRANAVGSYLVSKGVNVAPGSEIRGLGSTASLSQCQGIRGSALKACLWRDRRVEVEVL